MPRIQSSLRVNVGACVASRLLAAPVLPCQWAIGTGAAGLFSRRMVMSQQLTVHTRWMIRRDMPEVMEIENSSFDCPWSEDDFTKCLRQRNSIGFVAELDSRIIGHMIYELHQRRLCVLNFAVHPDFRRRKVGTQLIEKLRGKLSANRRNRITLAIRETNLNGQLFFSELGFRATSVERDYYDDSGEDAYVFQWRMPVNSLATEDA